MPSVFKINWRARGRGLAGACDTFVHLRGHSDRPGRPSAPLARRTATTARAACPAAFVQYSVCPDRHAVKRPALSAPPGTLTGLRWFDYVRSSSCHGETVTAESEGGTVAYAPLRDDDHPRSLARRAHRPALARPVPHGRHHGRGHRRQGRCLGPPTACL